MSGLSACDADDSVTSEAASFVHLETPEFRLGRVELVLDACLLLLVHGDNWDDASVRMGDKWVLALVVAVVVVAAAAAAALADSVLALALDVVVHRGAGVQILALDACSSFLLANQRGWKS